MWNGNGIGFTLNIVSWCNLTGSIIRIHQCIALIKYYE